MLVLGGHGGPLVIPASEGAASWLVRLVMSVNFGLD